MDHVGLGSDFDGVSGATPQGMDSAADLPKITQALLDRGYSADDIKKILGGNLLRVFREVESVSHEMQAGELKRGHRPITSVRGPCALAGGKHSRCGLGGRGRPPLDGACLSELPCIASRGSIVVQCNVAPLTETIFNTRSNHA